MDVTLPARQSSEIYEYTHENTFNVGSTASLTRNAAAPAGSTGIARTTSAGVAVSNAFAFTTAQRVPDDAGHTAYQNDQQAPPAPAPPIPFYKKRWFIISQVIIVPLGIILLFILLFPVVRAVVQLVVKKSTLSIDVATISQPQNNSFQLSLQGHVAHASLIPAEISFTEPVSVAWKQDNGSEIHLGNVTLGTLQTRHKQAVINQNTTFNIADEDAFGRFAAHMITSKTFTWRLQSNNLRVHAAEFPVSNGISFDKHLTMNGFDGFTGNVLLQDLKLPSDNPAGGINFIAVTQLRNPSPFSLNLGTVVFDLAYRNVSLGSGTGLDTKIIPGLNVISLGGYLHRQDAVADLAVVSELFTNYINGDTSPVIATGKSTLQSDNSTISWLSKGLQALQLNVPFKSLIPINPIQTITIGDLGLEFAEQNPWSPTAQSNSVQATLKLPFGFGLSIGEIQNDFNITSSDYTVVGLATPLGASTSAISVLGEADTSGKINISIANTKLTCDSPNHPYFSSFNANLTSLAKSEFRLVGHSRAVANLSIGQITLDPIKVDVPTSLDGLKGLHGLTTIDSVDVQGGSQDAINLGINVSIFNPSNLNLATGDLSLQLFRGGAVLGTALLPNLTLLMGNNSILASSNFQPNKSPQGLQTLNDFVGKKDVQLSIAGYDGSTKVTSLAEAFKTLDIGVTLPGLKTNLLDSAALKVLATTGRENNISHVTVDFDNPFSAALHITKISSTVKSFGVTLGNISTNTDFSFAPKAKTTSPDLDLDMNFDPSTLFSVTRALAVEASLDPAPLDEIVKIGGVKYLFTTGNAPSSQRRANIFTGFNLPKFVQAAFKNLKSDVELASDVTIGDYHTTLQYTQLAVPTVTDDSLSLILPVLAKPIVQKLVGGSVLGIDTVLITDPKQNSFGTNLKGSITNAGPFDAKIAFGSGLTVSWSGKPIGNIKLADVSVTGDVGATIDVESTFEVADVAHLTEFTKVLLTEESFDWEIAGENITVSALGIDVPGIALTSKKVTLKGFNGLKDGVQIKSFDLPSNDPAGGIHLTIEASATNPSQIGVELSSIGFDTYVGDVMIAPVASKSTVTLTPGTTSPLSLVGRLVPQTSAAGLSTVSGVFNNFVHGKDSDVVVHGTNAGPSDVTWLNEGIRALQIGTVLPNQGVLDIIKSISLNELKLLFTEGTAYNPSTSSKSTDAAFGLPFTFPIDISSLEQTITVGFDGQSLAQLALPRAPSTTDVERRIIHLTFDNVPFAVFGNQHSTFDKFVAATTIGKTQTIHLSGAANADAKTAVGLLSLTDISFSVDSTIEGLQGLTTRPVTVSNLDVNHGYPDYLLIKADSALFNPSNLTIGTGDVSFSLQFQDQTIGSADISNLIIIPGNASYPINVHYAPQGGAQAAGRNLLQSYIQGIDVDTTIAGSTSSTPINSLKSALSQIKLTPVKIPALHQTLITTASLTFPIDIVQTGIASASFSLANPFTASLNLLKVGATATYHGLNLGSIDHVDISSHPIHANGHSTITSPALPLKFNLDPSNIIQLLTIASHENGEDLGPLTQLFQFIIDHPNFHPPVKTTVDTRAPTCVSGQQFDAAGAILKSLTSLKVDLGIDTSVKIDDYATDLTFVQKAVTANTDKSALFLIGAVAGPIAQQLVDGAVLKFSEANITNISDDGFDLSLRGSLTNIGPLDALITFVEPVTVSWQGQNIAEIALPPICAAADTGVPDYQTKAHLKISDASKFTSFATFLLHNPSFEWTISTSKLRLNALGTIFDNVSLTKQVSFNAFNGLPGVTISNFELPSDDPAGGIHIETDALIPSHAQLGIDLGNIGFQAFFGGTLVGPLSGSNFFLAANSQTRLHLSGRIIPQSGSDLDNIGVLFSKFLAGENQTLTAKGNSVQPTGSSHPVAWLSNAFKTLSLDVILPGEKFKVIQSIALSDLSVTMQTEDQAFAPLTGSNFTLAKYQNPFGFSLQVVEAAEDIVLSTNGVDVAELNIPKLPASGEVSTGNVVDLVISFHNQPLKSINDATFQALFAAVTLEDSVSLNLKGTAAVSARTKVGDVAISGIPFDVPSGLKGIHSFGGVASLSNVSVTGSGGNGGSEFIVAPLTTTLQNPSNVSLQTVDIALPVTYEDVIIGRAAINPFNLIPGQNTVPTQFHYQPQNANDTVAQSFLTAFVQTGDSLSLSIKGDPGSTPFASLQPALSGLSLSTSLHGMNQPNIITHITVTISLESLVTNLVHVNFDLHNPLDVDLVVEFVQADSGVNGQIYAHFDQTFSSFVIPPAQTVNSGDFGNVLLTKGAIASLAIIPLGRLDIGTAATVGVGRGGYQIPWLHLNQKDVPTTYELALGFAEKAMSLNATSSSNSSVPSTLSGISTSDRSTMSVPPTATHSNDIIAPASSLSSLPKIPEPSVRTGAPMAPASPITPSSSRTSAV